MNPEMMGASAGLRKVQIESASEARGQARSAFGSPCEGHEGKDGESISTTVGVPQVGDNSSRVCKGSSGEATSEEAEYEDGADVRRCYVGVRVSHRPLL